MSADNIIYLQKQANNDWWVWEQSASNTPIPPVMPDVLKGSDRMTVIVYAHELQQRMATEYGVRELPRVREEEGKLRRWFLNLYFDTVQCHDTVHSAETGSVIHTTISSPKAIQFHLTSCLK